MKSTTQKVVIAALISVSTFFFATPLLAAESAEVEEGSPAPDFIRTIADYKLPDVEVTRKDDKKLKFIKELDDGRPVIMNFIFASCSAICPMLSHVFSQVQTKLAKDSQKVHLMSISIDPESDTPTILSEYAKKFGAGSDWDFYTGTTEASLAIQKAFNAFRGDKMNHSSVIFMRAAPGKSWVRLEGFVSPDVAIREYRSLR
ncbi:MAG: SCO family protein [Methyloglobulus sp.]|nr:SCO family protein [Methyloglobulus sp.]